MDGKPKTGLKSGERGLKMRKSLSGFLMASLVALTMCISSTAIAAETVRIGALFPFTGSLALLGQETFNGAVIFQDMINERGGLWGKKTKSFTGNRGPLQIQLRREVSNIFSEHAPSPVNLVLW
jgi:hypothetical protein